MVHIKKNDERFGLIYVKQSEMQRENLGVMGERHWDWRYRSPGHPKIIESVASYEFIKIRHWAGEKQEFQF